MVVVISRARPDLHNSPIRGVPIVQIQALALVHERDALVASIEPRLCRDARVALPDLELLAVADAVAGVEAEVGACDLDGGLPVVDLPLLGGRAVAVVAWMVVSMILVLVREM